MRHELEHSRLLNFVMHVNVDDISYDGSTYYECNLKIITRFLHSEESVEHYLEVFWGKTPMLILNDVAAWLYSNSEGKNATKVRSSYFVYAVRTYPSFIITWVMTDGSRMIEFITGDAISYFKGMMKPFETITLLPMKDFTAQERRQEWLIPEGSQFAEL